ncbi:MAG: hypothetical protein LBM96_09775 [Methanobrevibacter sp.]|jgi:hypothetical protein|nr:hypothetical protein [Candidatus Methanoflexus mossambicus]
MIKDRIDTLRQAAKVSTEENSDKMWCVIAGNQELINEIVYKSISSHDRVQILFREHIIIKESFTNYKFDFIMLWGETNKLRELTYYSKEHGGSYVKIAPYYVKHESNIMLIVGSDKDVKKFVGNVENLKFDVSILFDDHTTGFIATDMHMGNKLSKMFKTFLEPLFNMNDIVLTTILISVKDESNIDKIKELSKNHKVFVIDFQDINK